MLELERLGVRIVSGRLGRRGEGDDDDDDDDDDEDGGNGSDGGESADATSTMMNASGGGGKKRSMGGGGMNGGSSNMNTLGQLGGMMGGDSNLIMGGVRNKDTPLCLFACLHLYLLCFIRAFLTWKYMYPPLTKHN